MELMHANKQWSTRPADERFTSLITMRDHFTAARENSRQLVLASRDLLAIPDADNKGLTITGPNGGAAAPSHWAFGQLAQLAGAPAGYMRTLPSPIAADCINYGLRYGRDVEDIGLLLYKNGSISARAITGPKYGRVWNSDICSGLVERFGDGISGDWRVPGEFGVHVDVTQANTTLFAGDQDMFVFLADEDNRVEIANRRDGKPGTLARGFFVWNSEVGAATLGIATFLYDYVCCNRIVWGATEYREVRMRHSPSAPHRWVDAVAPALEQYKRDSMGGITAAIQNARNARVDNVDEFLAARFGKRLGAAIGSMAMAEEGRPIETMWDAVCAVTAQARSMGNQSDRVELERKGGELLTLAQ